MNYNIRGGKVYLGIYGISTKIIIPDNDSLSATSTRPHYCKYHVSITHLMLLGPVGDHSHNHKINVL